MNTRGDRWRNGRANDHLVYSPHDGQVARIKQRCFDNAVGLDSQLRCAQQPEMQSKVDVLGAPPAMAAEAAVCAGGTSVKFHETDRENGYENQSLVFSYEQCPKIYALLRLYFYITLLHITADELCVVTTVAATSMSHVHYYISANQYMLLTHSN